MKTVAVLFAMPIEAKPFLKHLKKATLRQQVRVGISGIGQENAAAKTAELLKNRPDALIITGFAGALDDGLDPGSIVVAGSISGSDLSYTCDSMLLKTALEAKTAHRRNILTLAKVANTTKEKREIASQYGYFAIDMESAAAASVVNETGTPFIAIRAISDTAHDALPKSIGQFITPDGQVIASKFINELFKNPTLVLSMIKMAIQSRKASKNLAKFLIDYLNRLT